MTDIVERLRDGRTTGAFCVRLDAADEIERLRKTAIETMHEMLRRANEIERLRAYANHERSLGAEGPMIELNNARQEIERLRADAQNGNRPLPYQRDELGRMVREAWVRWAHTQPNPKASWLLPYDELSEPDQEADRQIGEAIARFTLIGDAARRALEPKP